MENEKTLFESAKTLHRALIDNAVLIQTSVFDIFAALILEKAPALIGKAKEKISKKN